MEVNTLRFEVIVERRDSRGTRFDIFGMVWLVISLKVPEVFKRNTRFDVM